ncbi:hypothetical protein [Paremcibacter congregatus]|uniref:Transcriptional regulator n=1 Tax=Paremcibacter congregatus TaxID=2043170 RepID=A0A2G4YN10_9PROT|nr:hypothetical protein [Paremcibacter congregatus]PHZ83698.1 hypothetical protein CRD36_15085 [Paremcibacter congregatus]QDE27400.1 hypothetical protein FIV45_08910 [Paremcibacter congregatus]
MHTVKKWDNVESVVDSSFTEAMEYMAQPILDILKSYKTEPVEIETIADATDYTKDDIIGITKYLCEQHKLEIIQPAGADHGIQVKLTPKGLKSL